MKNPLEASGLIALAVVLAHRFGYLPDWAADIISSL